MERQQARWRISGGFRRGRSSLLLLTFFSSWLAGPYVANAAVLCVNKTGPQCTQTYPAAQIQAAFSAANLDQGSHDRIEIGPGTYPQGPFNAASNIEIVGAGMNETVLTHAAPLALNSIMLLANFGEPVIRDLAIRVGPGESNRGLQVAGGLVERIKVEATNESEVAPAMDAFGVTARNIEVTAPMDTMAVSGGGIIEDSRIRGGTALSWNSGVARRLRLSGKTAALMRGTSRLENSLLNATGPGAIGIAGEEFFSGNVAVSQVSVVGDGSPGSVGIQAARTIGGLFGPGSASIDMRNTVVTGFDVALRHRGAAGDVTSPCFPNCQLAQETSISWSLLDGRVEDQGGPGGLTIGAGMLDGSSPGFVDASRGDYRPRFDSPLIDAGQANRLQEGPFYIGESPLTIVGGPRLVAGKAQTATPRRDIGALEYERRAPAADFASAPTGALLYRPVAFTASATDPDDDPLTYIFDFGETGAGGSATPSPGPTASHAFLGLGQRQVRLTVTDPTGLAAIATAAVQVVALPGRCANQRVGSSVPDRFAGSPAGDDLRGRGGNDTLRGGPGADCLYGGPGHDRLVGGPGNDRLIGGTGRDMLIGGPGRDVLNGGPGNDRIVGGSGPDRVNAGPGNDLVNVRDGGRDVVDCGSGRRDRVLADRRDRLRNCEIVRRR